MQHTHLAGRDVPVQPGAVIKVYFFENREKDDPEGFYDFWTMENETSSVTGRCEASRDPGYRFRKIKGAETAVRVRPSSPEEVEDWLNNPDHTADASCAQFGELNGQPIRIGRDPVDGHYIVEVQAAPSPTEPSSSS